MAMLLTLARCLLILPFAGMFFIDAAWAMPAAFILFVTAALTDFLDGRVARARNQVTTLGAALDPLADKLLIAAALLLLTRNGVISGLDVVAALVILLREILVGGLREAAGATALPVTPLAKWKTAAQTLAIGLLLAAAPGGLADGRLGPFPNAVLWGAAILTFWTGAEYVARATTLLRRPASREL